MSSPVTGFKMTPARWRFLESARLFKHRRHLPSKYSEGMLVVPQQYAMVNAMLDAGLLEASVCGNQFFAQITPQGEKLLEKERDR